MVSLAPTVMSLLPLGVYARKVGPFGSSKMLVSDLGSLQVSHTYVLVACVVLPGQPLLCWVALLFLEKPEAIMRLNNTKSQTRSGSANRVKCKLGFHGTTGPSAASN